MAKHREERTPEPDLGPPPAWGETGPEPVLSSPGDVGEERPSAAVLADPGPSESTKRPRAKGPSAPQPADPHGAVPRVISPMERSPSGPHAIAVEADGALYRFKVRLDNYEQVSSKTLYILAHDEDEARECYAKAVGLDRHLEQARRSLKSHFALLGKEPPELDAPFFAVKRLPD